MGKDLFRRRERITVELPAELLASARKNAAAESRTLSCLVERALHDAVSTKPVAPPLSFQVWIAEIANEEGRAAINDGA